jgi:hypothetical protein
MYFLEQKKHIFPIILIQWEQKAGNREFTSEKGCTVKIGKENF